MGVTCMQHIAKTKQTKNDKNNAIVAFAKYWGEKEASPDTSADDKARMVLYDNTKLCEMLKDWTNIYYNSNAKDTMCYLEFFESKFRNIMDPEQKIK